MTITAPGVETGTLGLHSLEEYEPLIGAAAVDRIARKADALRDLHVVHVSSTFYGGGVSELLTPLTLMMNVHGIEAGWRMIQGTPAFFNVTKKLHNGLQGEKIELSRAEREIYEQVAFENATRLHIDDCDAIVVHDPQPLPLIKSFENRDMPWLWQCHVDLSAPDMATWNYLRPFVEQYDLTILSLHEYARELVTPQRFVMPAINPFSPKNRELSDDEIDECLKLHQIPTDRPLIAQVSRFDRWKDPMGVIKAFHLARKQADCTLVLLGNKALDDPEGELVLETIHSSRDERVIVITVEDPQLVNALQRRAAVVLQKSLREGFGLTVAEAMWKGTPVIGGNVGGIRRQIEDGSNGFLVDNVEQAAERIVQLLKDPPLRRRIGERARETVRAHFLMSRLLEDWLDVLSSFGR